MKRSRRTLGVVGLVVLLFATVGYVVIGLGSPGPHDAPWLGWLLVGLLGLVTLTLIGGPRWLLISIVGVAGAAAILYVGLELRRPVERPLAYWSIDDRTLGLLVGDAVNTECRVGQVDETGDGVRIHALCWERVLPVPGPGMLEPHVLEVSLQAPLGGRAVYDGSGGVARACRGDGPTISVNGVSWPDDCAIPG